MTGKLLSALADAAPSPAEDPLETPATRTDDGRVRVIVVDDERLIADTLCAILNEHGFHAVPAYNGLEAFDAALNLRADIVLTDVLMPAMSGVELAIRLRNQFPEIRIILISGQTATSQLVLEAEKQGHHFELLPKPIHPEELMAHLRAVMTPQTPAH